MNKDLILHDMAAKTDFAQFNCMSVEQFNESLSNGNPLQAEGRVWYYVDWPFTVTVVKCDGKWCCEITDDDEPATGIAQSSGYAAPWDAWEDTRKQILEED